MSEPIRQEVTLSASPERVYDCLTKAEAFAAFTGAPAEIDARAGGAVSLFGGRIQGCNVELDRARRVVQAWRSAAWPEGVYSIVRFDLDAEGPGTRLALTQAGFPDDARDMLAGGWGKMYFEPMRQALERA